MPIEGDPQSAPLLDRVLDTLATRTGLVAALAMLLAVGAYTGAYVERAVRAIEHQERIFDARQARNGFVSISDIQRLNLVIVDALREGQVTPEIAERFERSADIVYVRAESFRRTLAPELWDPAAERAIEGLEELIEISDRAIAQGFPDIPALATQITLVSDRIRGDLAIWNDEMRRVQGGLLADKSSAIRAQRRVVWFSLAGLTVVGVGALLLLRREVIGRIARRQAEERVAYLAYFDALTKLPNRPQFQERLETLLSRGEDIALYFVDLDHFKGINDTYGHAAGDATLQHVARAIWKQAIASNGFAARLGGDEFAVVVPHANAKRLISIGQSILEGVHAPFAFEGEGMQISVSIGVASSKTVASETRPTLDTLARYTDFALYVSKEEGRNRQTLYDESLKARYMERRSMLDALPRAISDGALDVYFQPKVALEGRRVYGFEALVRWRHGGRIIPPAEFIGIAEESGMIVELDVFVLEKAARVISDWNARFGTDHAISVNLSSLNFNSPRIIGKVERILAETGLRPELLTLEITETVELRDWEKVHVILTSLRSLGCRIAVDDFGTGFSSMAYLRAIMADELKIDRALMREIETSDQARFVFDTVLDLASNLGMDVVVEGVETEAQAEIVESLGARYAQGFLFGRPEAAQDALERTRVPVRRSISL